MARRVGSEIALSRRARAAVRARAFAPVVSVRTPRTTTPGRSTRSLQWVKKAGTTTISPSGPRPATSRSNKSPNS